jgi:hypothetical protein
MPLPSVGWHKGVIFVSSCCLCFGLIILFLAKQHIKKAREQLSCLSCIEGLRIALVTE